MPGEKSSWKVLNHVQHNGRLLGHQEGACSDLLQRNCARPGPPCVLAILVLVLLVVLMVVSRKSGWGEQENDHKDGRMRSSMPRS